MEIRRESNGGSEILEPVGRVDSATAREFEQTMVAVIDSGVSSLVVDFASLDYISSAGLRVVLVGAKAMRGKGGKLVLCGMSDQIRHVFDVSGFSKILTIVPDRAAALK